MKRQTAIELAVFVFLVALGIAGRVYFHYLPNFAPVAAAALFAGYFFRSWVVALAAPLAIMAGSDWLLGGYDFRLMAIVYAMLAWPVALRGILRARLQITRERPAASLAAGSGLLACALGSSVQFFLVTNFGWWATGEMYDHTAAGLLTCYVQAFAFFRYTLAGDLFYALLLFGGYALAVQFGWNAALRPAHDSLCATPTAS